MLQILAEHIHQLRYRRIIPVRLINPGFLTTFLVSVCSVTFAADAVDFDFKIAVETDGVYSVSFEALNYQGIPPPSQQLTLTVQGEDIPTWVNDGGDGIFGPGDSLVFVGRHLAGENSWFNEYSRYNIYWLSLKPNKGRRMKPVPPGKSGAPENPRNTFSPVLVGERLEQENLRIALPDAKDPQRSERWYMARLSHLDSKPYTWEPTSGTDQGVKNLTGIQVGLTGLSRDKHATETESSHHRVEVSLNGSLVGSGEWDGQEATIIEISDIDPALLAEAGNRIEIQVPRRKAGEGQGTIIDVSLLNWIEILYPIETSLPAGQRSLLVSGDAGYLPALKVKSAQMFSPSHGRMELSGDNIKGLMLDEPGRWTLVNENAYLSPAWVRANVPSELADTRFQADYLIITHALLLQAVVPLANYHRQNGLNVSVVDVEDIYDEFSHGIQSPYAIREFISHAWHNWKQPAPRFVLLVGDASWDIRNTQAGFRNLVPTLQVQAHDELAASDNGFVTIDGDDWRPDLAIGRIPASHPAELSAVVNKLIRYASDAPTGPWRREVTLITDRNPSFQSVSKSLAHDLGQIGIDASLLFPSPEGEDGGKHDQQKLKQSLTEGQLLVHFLGHGGRYIWRTGPPDFRSKTDLFSNSDVEALPANNRLPLVLSMTCSSGPFDHPSADSIAETFLRLPDRGAMGVLAATWRVPDSKLFSKMLIHELTSPGASIGEAIMRTKQKERHRALVESYNLLGDPAMSLALP